MKNALVFIVLTALCISPDMRAMIPASPVDQLYAASKSGDEERVQYLLNVQQVNPNMATQNFFANSPLQAASGGGHNNIVTLLLNANANPNHRSKVNSSAIQSAIALKNNDACIKALLAAKADIHTLGKNGQLPEALRVAIAMRNHSALFYLIAHGIDTRGAIPFIQENISNYLEIRLDPVPHGLTPEKVENALGELNMMLSFFENVKNAPEANKSEESKNDDGAAQDDAPPAYATAVFQDGGQD